MTDTSQEVRGLRHNGTLAVLLAGAALAFCGFVSLGVWQVHRLAWKEALIARVERNVQAAPAQAPGPSAWAGLLRERDEYRRVRVKGRFLHERETLVQASTELGAGYWVLTPLFTEQGFWVLVNRGFVPPDLKDIARREPPPLQSDTEVVGLLRLSEPGGGVLQQNDPAHGRWYSRDVQGIATAAALKAGQVAPYFIDATANETSGKAWPRPGLTVLRFSNNHLVYAFTWFALAAMTACAIGYLVIDERRLRRLAGERAHHELDRR